MAIALREADNYELLERIGSGSFGIIRKVKRKSDGYVLCRKEINYVKMSQKEREQLTTEFNILSSLRHPNIVAYYHREHLKASQDLYLYMEYCGGGDLGMIIKSLKGSSKYAEEEFVWRILSQLITALYRCHYGVDPPDPGSNILGPMQPPKMGLGLKGKKAPVMILHRDLKPENIFLGEDQSVKLGDFGLSKLLRSQDFASTYVGTPFYMSPEICAGEKYSLYSDIWAVGCIIYELCQKEPPFNARTHIQLIQKIREGRFAPLPKIYSSELQSVISSCLKVNPDHRPETATLLHLPVIRLMRKEKIVSDLAISFRNRESAATKKLQEAELSCARLEKEKLAMRAEIDNALRREWEVKARLEIDRLVQLELDKLRRQYVVEVQERISMELKKHKKQLEDSLPVPTSVETTSTDSQDTLEDELPSSTDISELSIDSPTPTEPKQPIKKGRTPFSRAKTTTDSPSDVQMSEPSPIALASLSLSPRRTGRSGRNIFADAAKKNPRWEPTLAYSDDEDDIPVLPSPTRPKVRPEPAKAPHPLLRQNTMATMQKMATQPSIFPSKAMAASNNTDNASDNGSNNKNSIPHPPLYTTTSQTDLRHAATEAKMKSPSRRLSKLPYMDPGSPSTKQPKSPTFKNNTNTSGSGTTMSNVEDTFKAAMQRNMGGRTLVELAQARAGGRSLDETAAVAVPKSKIPLPPQQPSIAATVVPPLASFPPATWDPEREEMPSPFLARGSKVIRNIR